MTSTDQHFFHCPEIATPRSARKLWYKKAIVRRVHQEIWQLTVVNTIEGKVQLSPDIHTTETIWTPMQVSEVRVNFSSPCPASILEDLTEKERQSLNPFGSTTRYAV